jgi:hypothetical protein
VNFSGDEFYGDDVTSGVHVLENRQHSIQKLTPELERRIERALDDGTATVAFGCAWCEDYGMGMDPDPCEDHGR